MTKPVKRKISKDIFGYKRKFKHKKGEPKVVGYTITVPKRTYLKYLKDGVDKIFLSSDSKIRNTVELKVIWKPSFEEYFGVKLTYPKLK